MRHRSAWLAAGSAFRCDPARRLGRCRVRRWRFRRWRPRRRRRRARPRAYRGSRRLDDTLGVDHGARLDRRDRERLAADLPARPRRRARCRARTRACRPPADEDPRREGLPAGGSTQRPGSHAHAPGARSTRRPATRAVELGSAGTTSTRAGGGGRVDLRERARGLRRRTRGCRSEGPHAAEAATSTSSRTAMARRSIGALLKHVQSRARSARCDPPRSSRRASPRPALVSLAGCSSIPRGAPPSTRCASSTRASSTARRREQVATAARRVPRALPRRRLRLRGLRRFGAPARSGARGALLPRPRLSRGPRARRARRSTTATDHVRVEIVVDEGPPTLNRNGARRRSGGPAGRGRAKASATPRRPRPAAGAPLRRRRATRRRKVAVVRALTDRGYAYATVAADAQVDLAAHAVDYSFTVKPGPPAVFGAITIVGPGSGRRRAPRRRRSTRRRCAARCTSSRASRTRRRSDRRGDAGAAGPRGAQRRADRPDPGRSARARSSR